MAERLQRAQGRKSALKLMSKTGFMGEYVSWGIRDSENCFIRCNGIDTTLPAFLVRRRNWPEPGQFIRRGRWGSRAESGQTTGDFVVHVAPSRADSLLCAVSAATDPFDKLATKAKKKP